MTIDTLHTECLPECNQSPLYVIGQYYLDNRTTNGNQNASDTDILFRCLQILHSYADICLEILVMAGMRAQTKYILDSWQRLSGNKKKAIITILSNKEVHFKMHT